MTVDGPSARGAVADDLWRIVELAGEARTELRAERGGEMWAVREARPEPEDARLAELVAATDALVAVGTFDGSVVGYAVVEIEVLRDGTRLARLSDVFVARGARGIGVGEALMDHVLTWCAAQGCQAIESYALPGMRESKNFFERFGLKARQLIVHRRLDGEAGDPSADPSGAGGSPDEP